MCTFLVQVYYTYGGTDKHDYFADDGVISNKASLAGWVMANVCLGGPLLVARLLEVVTFEGLD